MNIFGGMNIFWIFFWGHHKVGLYLVVISMQFRVSSSELGLPKIQIFFWVLEIPDFFFWSTVDAGPEPTYAEKMREPPWGLRVQKNEVTVNGLKFRTLLFLFHIKC